MNNSQKIILTIAVSAFSSMAVMASDRGHSAEYEFFEAQSTPSFTSSKTREEVLAELAEAQRTGDIAVTNDHENAGQKLNELYPESYPKKLATPGKSRSQVLDELAAAQRSGELKSRTKEQSAY